MTEVVRAAETLAIGLLSMLLTACDAAPPAQTICPTLPEEVAQLTPAPPGETLLHRWQRTKADWERIQAQKDALEDRTRYMAVPAYSALEDAEKAMAKAQCGELCK
jgi:hypothetical protein